MPDGYLGCLEAAVETYRHQLVWDPATAKVVPITPYPAGRGLKDMPQTGPSLALPPDTARELVLGNIDPETLERYPDPAPAAPENSGGGGGVVIVNGAPTPLIGAVSPTNVERYISNKVGRDPASWNHPKNAARKQPFDGEVNKEATMAREYWGKIAAKRQCRFRDGGVAAFILVCEAGQIAFGMPHPGSTNGKTPGLSGDPFAARCDFVAGHLAQSPAHCFPVQVRSQLLCHFRRACYTSWHCREHPPRCPDAADVPAFTGPPCSMQARHCCAIYWGSPRSATGFASTANMSMRSPERLPSGGRCSRRRQPPRWWQKGLAPRDWCS